MRIESVVHSILMGDNPPRLGVNVECVDSGCHKIHPGVQLPTRQSTGKLGWAEDLTVSALLEMFPPWSQVVFGKNPAASGEGREGADATSARESGPLPRGGVTARTSCAGGRSSQSEAMPGPPEARPGGS